jgi:hypothetical protein
MRALLLLFVLLTACTTLGPMPTTTGMSAIPANRPGVEVQRGLVPAFYLSDAAQEGEPFTPVTAQTAALIEPDRILGTRGLVVGARQWGESGDAPFEPMVGLRRKVDKTFALAGFAYGTRASGAESGASYTANRLGGEFVVDAQAIPIFSWLALHVHAAVSATWIDAAGVYCAGADGLAVDCEDTSRRVAGDIRGLYTAATAGLSLDFARRPTGVVHGVRLSFVGSISGMPRIRDGVQEKSDDQVRSFGLTLTVGLGSDR